MMRCTFSFIILFLLILPISLSEDSSQEKADQDSIDLGGIEEHKGFILKKEVMYKEPSSSELEELKNWANKQEDPTFKNSKKCPVALLIVIDEKTKKVKSGYIESNVKRCEKKISKYFFTHNKELASKFKNLALNKEYLDVIDFLKKEVDSALSSDVGDEETSKELEDNYQGLVADGSNKINIKVTIPNKVKYDKLFYRAKGKLTVDETQKDKRIIIFTYAPHLLLDSTVKTEVIEIKLLDKNNEVIENLNKKITLVRPPVIFIHGLWGSSEHMESLRVTLQDYFHNKRICCDPSKESNDDRWVSLLKGCKSKSIAYSDKCLEAEKSKKSEDNQIQVSFSYDWEDDNADSIIDASYGFKEYVEDVLDEKFRQQKIKPGKYDIVAHSAGGIIARYYISSGSMLGFYRVRKLITFGTPHLGETNFQYIWEFCPSILVEDEIKYCAAYKKVAEGIKKLMRKFSSFDPLLSETDFFESGPYVKQLLPRSSFIKKLNLHPPYDNKIEYVFIAGTKGPLSVIRKEPPIKDIWMDKSQRFEEGFTRWFLPNLALAIGKYYLNIEIPEEGKIIFGNLFYILSEEFYSDGLVHLNSAHAIEVTKEKNEILGIPKEIIKGRRIDIPINHLVLLAPGQLPLIITQLYDKKYDVLAKGSPIDIHAYDKYGNHIGIEENDVSNEIPGAFFVMDGDIQYLYLPSGERYRYEIEGTGDGSSSLILNKDGEGKYKIISFSNFNVSEKTSVEFLPSKEIARSSLMFDVDNDDVIDNKVYPDFTLEGEYKKQESEASEYTTGVIYAPKRFNKAWFLLLVIPLIAIMFIIKRKREY